MATSDLKIVLSVVDQASSAFSRINGNLEQISKTSVLVGGAITGVFAYAVKQAGDAEQGIAQLNAVLKSTKGAAGVSSDAAIKLSDSLQDVTTFSNDAVLGAENMLLTFTKIGKEVFPQATETVLNMATALGEDSKDAAIQLGKALNDPIQGVTALRRVGVQFTDQQQAQIKTLVESGRTLEAQRLILAELGTEFGGSARAKAATFEGQLVSMKNAADDLAKVIGGILLPMLTSMLEGLKPVIASLIEWSNAHPELLKYIVIVTSAMGVMLLAAGSIGFAIIGINTALGSFATLLGVTAPEVLIIAGIIAGLAVVFYNVYQITKLLLTSLPEIIAGIKAYWGEFLSWVNEKFLKPIEKAFSDIWTSIKTTVVGIISDIKGYIQPIIDMVNNLLDGLARVASTVGSGISGAIKSTVNFVSGARADGGPVKGGSTYLVGERGPELFTAGNSGSIIPNHALAGGGSIVVNMSNSTFLSEDVARQIGDKIISQFKRLNR